MPELIFIDVDAKTYLKLKNLSNSEIISTLKCTTCIQNYNIGIEKFIVDKIKLLSSNLDIEDISTITELQKSLIKIIIGSKI